MLSYVREDMQTVFTGYHAKARLLPCALRHITHHALNVFLMQYKWTQATLLGLTPEDAGWKVRGTI